MSENNNENNNENKVKWESVTIVMKDGRNMVKENIAKYYSHDKYIMFTGIDGGILTAQNSEVACWELGKAIFDNIAHNSKSDNSVMVKLSNTVCRADMLIDLLCVDVDRSNSGESRTSIQIIDMKQGKCRTVGITGGTFKENAKTIVDILIGYRVSKIVVNDIGLGLGIKDEVYSLINDSNIVDIDDNGNLCFKNN